MRKLSALILGMAIAGTGAYAQAPDSFRLPQDYDPLNLNYAFSMEQMQQLAAEHGQQAPSATKRTSKMREVRKEAKTVAMFAAGQTYHKDYRFNYEGGTVATYNIEVKVDGDRVTISNLFNLAAQSTSIATGEDWDVVGTYDATAKTITIPAITTSLDAATKPGKVGSYTTVLMAGEVNESGKMAPADELVLKVEGDFDSITTDMDFGIGLWADWYGGISGTQTLYRRFVAAAPNDTPNLIAFNDSFSFTETYPETPSTRNVYIINMSSSDVDYAINVESDGNVFSITPNAGVIEGMSAIDCTMTLNAPAAGDYEGIATVTYEGGEPLNFLMFGNVIDVPDYSAIVKSGDFKFSTGIDCPFIMTEADGHQVARSNLRGYVGSAWISVKMTVPENNIGTFSWKGKSINESWYSNAGGYFIDDAPSPAAVWYGTMDCDSSIELAPGEHVIRFQYDAVGFTPQADTGLYIYDLELVNTPAEASKAVVDTPEIDLGSFLIRDGAPVSGEGTIVIRNKGLNPLTVTSVSSSDNAFSATAPSAPAALLESIEIPVTFNSSKDGKFNTTITINTSAGTLTANVKALVRVMADFSSVVTLGSEYVTSIDTDNANPFTVADGMAYNANTGIVDDVQNTSWFQINYTVPEGKAAYISWDGHCFTDAPDPNSMYSGDYLNFEIAHPMNTGSKGVNGDNDAGSEAVFASDEFWKPYLTSIPGEHHVKFTYYKNGDGHISELDRVEISNFRIEVVDFPEHGFEIESETPIEFEPTFVGDQRYTTATVRIRNTGSSELEVLEVGSADPFYAVMPEGYHAKAQFNNSIEVTLWFFPSKEGDFSDNLIIKTNAGDVSVPCHGITKSMEGIVLAGDVENDGYGWSFYDADGDGFCWNLGSNLWGFVPIYNHGGNQCFASNSFTFEVGAVEPDNWLFSPVITIPADGAMLQWYAAGFHDERFAENYSVYVATPEELKDPSQLHTLTPVFTEEIPEGGMDAWTENSFDLADYAGKDVAICFRHHDCNGQYILRLDDVMVYTRAAWEKVDQLGAASEAVSTEIYDINGVRLNGLTKGINIIRVTNADGTVKTSKLMVK